MCLLRRRGGASLFLSLSITWFNLDSGAFKCSTVSERAFYFLSEHVELSVKLLSSLCISFYLFSFLSVAPRHARLDVRRAVRARLLFTASNHRNRFPIIGFTRYSFCRRLVFVSLAMRDAAASLSSERSTTARGGQPAIDQGEHETQYLVSISRVKKHEGRLYS